MALSMDLRFGRDIFNGVIGACRAGQWRWWLSSPMWIGSEPVDLAQAMPVRGVIGYMPTPSRAGEWPRKRIPIVNVAGCEREPPGVHTVTSDHTEVGRVAARHLIERGYESFAMLMVHPSAACRMRAAGFRECVEPVGPVRELCTQRGGELASFLRELPPTTAIFCANDAVARYAVVQLLMLGRHVPEQFAVVGVDDDPLYRNLSPVPLSSVDIRPRMIGRLAAETMRTLLDGGDCPQRQLLQPGEVIERQSSDLYAVPDPKIVDLLRRIRARATEGIRVADVLKPADGARRTVELKFRRYLKRSIGDEIRRCRLEAAREMLLSTSLSIEDIAYRCGFSDAGHFSRLFKSGYGKGPGQYRDGCKEI